MSFVHARTFETRWGLGLAFIDLDDETNVEMLKLQLWAPVGEDGSDGKVCIKIGLNPEASDEAHELMSAGNRQALAEMDAAKFEAVMERSGASKLLDTATGRATKD